MLRASTQGVPFRFWLGRSMPREPRGFSRFGSRGRMTALLPAASAGVAVVAWVVWQGLGDPAAAAPESSPSALEVSENARFLQHADGTPFFYLGDTAWELFHRLSREEAEDYLEDRRSKGFNVIQAVALAELGGTTVPNAYGDLPLVDRDPTRPIVRGGDDDDYWGHVDHVIDRAGEKGMYVGLLPTWGDKVEQLDENADERIFTTVNARSYGRFLGERYRDKSHIIWILGGDRGPNDFDIEIWREMARGLSEGDGGAHLMTYHPTGGRSSAELLHADPLFDFNMVQTGHCGTYQGAARLIATDYARTPAKPTIDGEPRYEDHPKCFRAQHGRWDGHDARHLAYLQTFSGAFGHTYGHHSIWQFWEPGREPITEPETPWRTALDAEGAGQMQHVRRLLESRPFFSRVPDQGLVVGDQGSDEGLIRATRDSGGAYAMVYAGTGESFSVDLGRLSGERVTAWWYDPRTGVASAPEEITKRRGELAFDPPGSPSRTNDWVLVLDDAARNFGAPGATRYGTFTARRRAGSEASSG